MGLERAYMRRVRWEARVLADEVARAFVGDEDTGVGASRGVSRSGQIYERVSPQTLMARMGAEWQ